MWIAAVLVVLLASVVIFGGAWLLGYLFSFIADRCFKTDSSHTMHEGTTDRTGVACDAGLTYMTKEERRRVLLSFFKVECFNEGTPRDIIGASDSDDTSVHTSPSQKIQDEENGEGSLLVPAMLRKSEGADNVSAAASRPKCLVIDTSDTSESTTTFCCSSEEEGNENVDAEANIENVDQIDKEECAICLSDYINGDKVIVGKHCSHKFHSDCLLDWLDKHDACPFCREDMLSADEMREEAANTFGEAHVGDILRRDCLCSVSGENYNAESFSRSDPNTADVSPVSALDEENNNPHSVTAALDVIMNRVRNQFRPENREFVRSPPANSSDLEEARLFLSEVDV